MMNSDRKGTMKVLPNVRGPRTLSRMNTYKEVWPTEEENPLRKFTRTILRLEKSRSFLCDDTLLTLLR